MQVDEVREAARSLSVSTAEQRNGVLRRFVDALRENSEDVLAANARDLERAHADKIAESLIDRLELNPERLASMCDAINDVIALDDPLGEEIEHRTLENGLDLRKVRVPFGVVCVVYEARPNVTSDAAAICIKTGNGGLLRGSTQAQATNEAILACLRTAFEGSGIDPDCVQGYDPTDREGFRELIATEGSVDLVIPRGGEGLKKFLYEHARVPILAAAGGNCHVYVDASADADMARAIIVNAKTQRPGVCNAAETLLVHESRSDDLLPLLVEDLEAAGVEVLRDEHAWATEFLDMQIALRVVPSVEAAVEHINRYGTKHSEAIVTNDDESAETFERGVDAAAVYVNASTRFTDGGVYGLGAEVGISTNKLHARGPIGLRELTTTKYLVHGTGHVRS
jgi:glutamate-5-semialdehyde dehydrogenase